MHPLKRTSKMFKKSWIMLSLQVPWKARDCFGQLDSNPSASLCFISSVPHIYVIRQLHLFIPHIQHWPQVWETEHACLYHHLLIGWLHFSHGLQGIRCGTETYIWRGESVWQPIYLCVPHCRCCVCCNSNELFQQVAWLIFHESVKLMENFFFPNHLIFFL